jgi:hypothetical protein
MTCDDAFNQLTTPGSSDNPQLAAHLAQCTRCRAMAETLAPAIELFAPPGAASRPATTASATAIAQQSAARLGRRFGPVRLQQWSIRRHLALLAAAVSGAACCFLAIQLGRGDVSPSSASCPRKSPVASEWMERHALPVAMACIACHPTGGGQLVPSSARPATAVGGGPL